jgi:hypothetical protein
MSEARYISRVHVERIKGPLKRLTMPAEAQTVLMGVHSDIAEHYRVAPGSMDPHAATLDYIVAAAAG